MLAPPGDPDRPYDPAEAPQLARAVQWWYRVHVKARPDTVETIAAEVDAPAPIIEAWIAEAQRLLDAVAPEALHDV